jgi:hypothetical protein
METSPAAFSRRAESLVRRVLLVAAGLAILLAVAASAPAAAPSYTEWTAPVSLGAPIATSFAESGPALSRDGLSLFFYSSRPGGLGGFDLMVSQRATMNGAWGTPVNLGATVNSASADSVPALSRDEHWLFFASDRPGGFGGNDVWGTWRPDVDDDHGWQAPVNLGPNVNTALTDFGPAYFENPDGRTQLFFGSQRAGGLGERDLYVSELQADGTWGPASWLPELSSAFNEPKSTITDDGLQIFFFRGISASLTVDDLWVSTRATVDAPWSPPVNLGAVNSAAGDAHPYVSGDGRTLLFGSNRPGGLGSTDIYMTTRAAMLTATADDQSRLFGQANPALTTAISGFVGGETSAVVSGTASCTTTATTSSPAGDYPITCSVGSLSAPGYVFETFVSGTLTVAYSAPCLSGPSSGPLHVASGESVCIGAGGSQTGPVTVAAGGSLDVEGGRITGPVTAGGAAVVRICDATITGPLTIAGSTGPVLVGGEGCDSNTIVGLVRVTDSAGGVEVVGNTVVGPLRVTGNAAPVLAAGNTVTGPVTVQP